jgi:hypothetical protein
MKRLFFLLLLFTGSCAQKSDKGSAFESDKEIEHDARLRSETLEYICGLSPEQTKSVYELIVKGKTETREMKSLKSVNREEYRLKRKENVSIRYKELKALLSPEQIKKMESYLVTQKYFKDFW